MLMRDEEGRKKEQARSNKQQGKAKQHSTPKAVTFPKKKELPRMGLKPTTLHTLDSIYIYMIQVSLAKYVCSSGLWLGGLLNLSFLSTFLS